MQNELKQFGGALKKEREQKEITLKSISNNTKISINFLENIESGNFNFLPDPYPRNFLRIYLMQFSRHVDKILEEYDKMVNISNAPEIIVEKALKYETPSDNVDNEVSLLNQFHVLKKKYFPVFAVGAAIVLFIIVISTISNNNSVSNIAPNNYGNIVKQDSQLAAFSPFTLERKKIKLNLVASQKTWMQIVIDDSISSEHIFNNGDSSEWFAKEKFLIRIGNGGGIRLYLNDNDLGPLGNEREVIKLLLTKDGIQDSQF